jgi:hypothetical protein
MAIPLRCFQLWPREEEEGVIYQMLASREASVDLEEEAELRQHLLVTRERAVQHLLWLLYRTKDGTDLLPPSRPWEEEVEGREAVLKEEALLAEGQGGLYPSFLPLLFG